MAQGKTDGYEQWAKKFNVKQMSKTLNFLTKNKLLRYADLDAKAAQATEIYDGLMEEIKSAEKRMAEIQVLRTHISGYAKTREVYTAYRKAGYSKKFFEEHRADLTLHKLEGGFSPTRRSIWVTDALLATSCPQTINPSSY